MQEVAAVDLLVADHRLEDQCEITAVSADDLAHVVEIGEHTGDPSQDRRGDRLAVIRLEHDRTGEAHIVGEARLHRSVIDSLDGFAERAHQDLLRGVWTVASLSS